MDKYMVYFSVLIMLLMYSCVQKTDVLNPDADYKAEFLSNKDTRTFIPDGIKVLVPLRIGNFWEYRLDDGSSLIESIDSVFDSDGMNIFIQTGIYDRWISAKAVYNLKKGYVIDVIHYVNDTNNVNYIFKFPCAVGSTWNNESNFWGYRDPTHYTLLSKKEIITVTAGEFECYAYQVCHGERVEGGMNDNHFCQIYYFSPSVGLILICKIIGDDCLKPLEHTDKAVVKELIDFHISE